MQYSKKVIATMPKAYAIGMFDGEDARSFVIGVEKDGPHPSLRPRRHADGDRDRGARRRHDDRPGPRA